MSRNSQFDFYDSLRHPDKLDPEILPDGRARLYEPRLIFPTNGCP
jgi:hypothetical protein